MGPKLSNRCPYKKAMWQHRDTPGEGHVTTEQGLKWGSYKSRAAKHCWQPPEAGKREEDSCLEPSESARHHDTLNLNFLPPELRENTFHCFKRPSSSKQTWVILCLSSFSFLLSQKPFKLSMISSFDKWVWQPVKLHQGREAGLQRLCSAHCSSPSGLILRSAGFCWQLLVPWKAVCAITIGFTSYNSPVAFSVHDVQ